MHHRGSITRGDCHANGPHTTGDSAFFSWLFFCRCGERSEQTHRCKPSTAPTSGASLQPLSLRVGVGISGLTPPSPRCLRGAPRCTTVGATRICPPTARSAAEGSRRTTAPRAPPASRAQQMKHPAAAARARGARTTQRRASVLTTPSAQPRLRSAPARRAFPHRGRPRRAPRAPGAATVASTAAARAAPLPPFAPR